MTEIELSGIYFLPEEKGICQVLFELRTEGAFPREGQSYRGASPHPLCDALRSTLHEVLERTEALHGTIEAFGLTLSGRPEPTSESSRFITAPPAGRSARVQGMMSWRVGTDSRDSVEIARRQEAIPILYRGQPSGSLSLHLSSSNERLRRQQEREALGRELGLRLARIEIHHWARNKLDLDISLIGESASFTRLEAEIAKVGAVLYPVVIEAEFGSRELEIAAAIHCSSPRRDGPFVVFHCTYSSLHEFDLRLDDALTRASDGSLFLSGVDLLDDAAQRQLLYRLRQGRQMGSTSRIMVSSGSLLSALESEGKFCRMLRTEIDVLGIRIPPLRERREDIRILLESCLQKHGLDQQRCLSPAVWQACLAYDWPRNEAELERFAIRLAVMTDTACIDLSDLKRIVSWLPAETEPTVKPEIEAWPASFGPTSFGEDLYEENEEPTPSQRQWLELLAGRLVAGEFESLEGFGIGMQRALRYVGEHFQEEIPLGQLARQSFISVSHLSFLFKRDVGVPFKTLLASVRIEKARQLLLENRQQSITEISLDAGFGDLSHFERTFKRLIGTNPRDYRRQQLSASAKVQQA